MKRVLIVSLACALISPILGAGSVPIRTKDR